MDSHYYRACVLCPNRCGVDRSRKAGMCGETDQVRVAWSGLHRGEEPPVTGERGSGMIFFSGCPLHCAYCQNHQISKYGSALGKKVSVSTLATMMLELESMGAANINLVTPTHFYPSIVAAIREARERGLSLPIVNNTSGYETEEGLSLIDPYIDLYLVDGKTLSGSVSKKFCGRGDYSSHIKEVLEFLVTRHPEVKFDRDGRMSGVLVRHLLFPGTLDATLEFLSYYAKNLKPYTWLSLMVQFVPPSGEPMPPVTESEYRRLLDALEVLEIENGFVQDLEDNIAWIPDFSRPNPFPAEFADPLPYFLSL